MCGRKFTALLLSFSLFGPSFPVLSYSEEATEIPETYLPKLYAIVMRYEKQTEILKSELSASQINLTELGKKLQTYEDNETIYKKNATEYETRIISLSQESEALKKAQADSTRLTEISEASWTRYAERAETKIKRLDRKVKALTFVAVLLGGSAIVAGTAWAVK